MEKLKNHSLYDKWIIIFFIVSMVLQGGLAFVNREANDDHIEVVQRIMLSEATLKESCIQCYHPRLYHNTIVNIAEMLDVSEKDQLILIGQFVNVIAGALVLLFIWLFISELKYSKYTKRLAFILVALNPELISSNIQATNNSFAILFGTMAIYFIWKYFLTEKILYYVLLLVSVILAAVSKGSGLVLFGTIVVVLLINSFSLWKNKKMVFKSWAFLSGFILIFLTSMFFFSPYFDYYKNYGSPLVGNWITQPAPKFTDKTYYARPGILSVVDGYFTFRIFDLIKNPSIGDSYMEKYNLNRTSFWTLLYARTFSIHYPLWPSSWENRGEQVAMISRGIFVLALVPAFLVLLGFFLTLKKIIKGLLKEKLGYFVNNTDWIFVLLFIIMLAVVFRLSWITRDYATVKMVYIYPVILAPILFFLEGHEFIYQKIGNKGIFKKISVVWITLFVLTIFDLFLLFQQLAK